MASISKLFSVVVVVFLVVVLFVVVGGVQEGVGRFVGLGVQEGLGYSVGLTTTLLLQEETYT